VDLYQLYQSIVTRGGIAADAPDPDWLSLARAAAPPPPPAGAAPAPAGAAAAAAVRQLYQARVRGFLDFMADLVLQYEIAKREGAARAAAQQGAPRGQYGHRHQRQRAPQAPAAPAAAENGSCGYAAESGSDVPAHEQQQQQQQQRQRPGSSGLHHLDSRPASQRPAGRGAAPAGGRGGIVRLGQQQAQPAPRQQQRQSSLASRPAARSPAPEVPDPVPGDRLRSALAWVRGASLGLAEKPYADVTAVNAALWRRYRGALGRAAAASRAALPLELYPLFGAEPPAAPRRSGRTRAQAQARASTRGSSE
jgi:hypothetical protein